MVLLLFKNLYGLKDACLTWFVRITSGLTNIGFSSRIIIMYVDDCVIISRLEGEADEIMRKIKNKVLKLTDDGIMETYLGIQIDRHEDGESPCRNHS